MVNCFVNVVCLSGYTQSSEVQATKKLSNFDFHNCRDKFHKTTLRTHLSFAEQLTRFGSLLLCRFSWIPQEYWYPEEVTSGSTKQGIIPPLWNASFDKPYGLLHHCLWRHRRFESFYFEHKSWEEYIFLPDESQAGLPCRARFAVVVGASVIANGRYPWTLTQLSSVFKLGGVFRSSTTFMEIPHTLETGTSFSKDWAPRLIIPTSYTWE